MPRPLHSHSSSKTDFCSLQRLQHGIHMAWSVRSSDETTSSFFSTVMSGLALLEVLSAKVSFLYALGIVSVGLLMSAGPCAGSWAKRRMLRTCGAGTVRWGPSEAQIRTPLWVATSFSTTFMGALPLGPANLVNGG